MLRCGSNSENPRAIIDHSSEVKVIGNAKWYILIHLQSKKDQLGGSLEGIKSYALLLAGVVTTYKDPCIGTVRLRNMCSGWNGCSE